MNAATPAADFIGADNFFWLPVTAFDQHIGLATQYGLYWCVLVKPGDQVDHTECCDQRHTVFQRIDRPIRSLAETPNRVIGIERDDQACAQLFCLRQVGCMATMQNVEHAICEYQRTSELCDVFFQ